jgi:hypothetical protein
VIWSSSVYVVQFDRRYPFRTFHILLETRKYVSVKHYKNFTNYIYAALKHISCSTMFQCIEWAKERCRMGISKKSTEWARYENIIVQIGINSGKSLPANQLPEPFLQKHNRSSTGTTRATTISEQVSFHNFVIIVKAFLFYYLSIAKRRFRIS